MRELKIWMNGRLVPQAEAVLPVNSAAVFYATNVFEGIRAYWNPADEELYGFRLKEHVTRLRESMKMMRFTVPYSDEDLQDAVREVLRGNELREDIHMHLVAYVVGVGLDATTPTGLYINPRRRARVAPESGLRCCVSSWLRIADSAMPPRLKCIANYHNGRLAALQARADGYDGTFLLNSRGKVSETPGATMFLVRTGRPITPSITSDILESITRDSLIRLFAEAHGLTVEEREVDRTELYVAQEIFVCGSAFEVTPVVSVDRYSVGDGRVGPLTKAIQATYLDVARGQVGLHREWLTPVYGAKQ